jgi:hypothetical protein
MSHDDLGVSQVLCQVNLRRVLNLLEIRGFQRVIGPLIGVDKIEFGFCIP